MVTMGEGEGVIVWKTVGVSLDVCLIGTTDLYRFYHLESLGRYATVCMLCSIGTLNHLVGNPDHGLSTHS